MPFTPVPLTARVTVSGTTVGHPWANVFHVSGDSSMTAADVTYLASNFLTAYQNRFKSLMDTNTQIATCDVVALDSTSAPATGHTAPVSGTDSSSGAVSMNSCLVLSWEVPTRYRGGHSRTYLPGVPTSKLSGAQNWDPTYVGTAQTAAADFRTDVNALTPPDCAPVELVVVHYRRGGVALSPGQPETISGVIARTHIGSQRRRL